MSDRLPILTASLGEQRRGLTLWALALAGVAIMYLSFYPSMGGDSMDELIADLPDEFVTALGYDRIGTAAGWVTTTVYGLLGPILLLVFAIASFGRTLAGNEERGELELELTAPITRRRVLLERSGAQTLAVAGLVVVVALVTYAMALLLDMDLRALNLAATSAGLFLLVIGHGLVAIALGAAWGRRAIAVGGAAALAVAGFMADALGPVAGWHWLEVVSPFYWYLGEDPLSTGPDYRGLLLLGALSAAALISALAVFGRRDLMA